MIRWLVRHRWLVIDPRVSHVCLSGHRRQLRSFIRTAVSCDRASYSRRFFLALHAGIPTLFEFCCAQSFCWMSPLLDADPSFPTWLCVPRSGGTSQLRHVWWSFLALFRSRASRTSGTVASAADPDSFSRVFSLWSESVAIHRVPGCSFCSFSISFCAVIGIFDDLVGVLHLRESSRCSPLSVPFASLALIVAYRQAHLPLVLLFHGFCTA